MKSLRTSGLLQQIYVFFSASTHKWELLNREIKLKFTLKCLSQTRWSCLCDADEALKDNYGIIACVALYPLQPFNQSNRAFDKKQKVQDSTSDREFQTWRTEKYGMISIGDKAVCVLCSGTGVSKTSSVKQHFETNRKSFRQKGEPDKKELIEDTTEDRIFVIKYVSKNCPSSAACYSTANAIARHSKPFQEGVFEGSVGDLTL
ncbi:general transcription factor II-I repeat domain-containing protein 2A [Trichonephila clavipes]|nr:general transcription factor II-I repeat domain-containing protein 2A [Trichonephila clavipes]